MKQVARILYRKDAAGLVVKLGKGLDQEGIYDIYDFSGELMIKYQGKSALQEESANRAGALTTNELFGERPFSMMTRKEIDELN